MKFSFIRKEEIRLHPERENGNLLYPGTGMGNTVSSCTAICKCDSSFYPTFRRAPTRQWPALTLAGAKSSSTTMRTFPKVSRDNISSR